MEIEWMQAVNYIIGRHLFQSGKQRKELHGSGNFNGEEFPFDDLRSAFSANYRDAAEL